MQNIDQLQSYLSPRLQKALDFIKNTELFSLSDGRHNIDGDDIYISIAGYETKNKVEKRAEAHKQYIDIQLLLAGSEVISHSMLSTDNEVLEDNLAEKDVIFYKTVQNETDIVLKPGNYVIFFPWDVHRPGCAHQKCATVKKAVVKVRI